MLLDTGSEARFQMRPERLILNGQQRLTSPTKGNITPKVSSVTFSLKRKQSNRWFPA
jgi:hypothetical protein